MATLTFDTYDFIESLKSSGLEERQAKAIADNFRKIDVEHVASTNDISGLQTSISRLEVKIESVKSDIFKWLIPLILGQYLMIFGLFAKHL